MQYSQKGFTFGELPQARRQVLNKAPSGFCKSAWNNSEFVIHYIAMQKLF